jgi:hypothetical protein
MPKVLRNLRIDEISRGDRGAVTRVVLLSSQSDMADQLVEVCKGINVGDVTPPTEHELVAEIQKLANAKRLPGETVGCGVQPAL